MNKLRTALLISILCFASYSALPAQSTRSRAPVRKASSARCATKFHTLSKYESDWWSKIYSDREVAPALKRLLKSDYGLLRESLKHPAYPGDSDSFRDKNGVLTLEGGVKGLYTIMEAKLIVEPCGNIYAAILDGGKQFLFFTNDQKYIDRLPPAIEEWRVGVESRRSQPSEVPKLPVVFRNK
jgi:hypothetical protein